jgi:hypothetical protein
MSKISFLPLLAALAIFNSCRPRPLQIDIVQSPPVLVVSSATADQHTVLVSAAYSINSLLSLDDTVNGADLPPGVLLENAVVTLASPGRLPDTLRHLAKGLYGNRDLELQAGTSYHLDIYRPDKGLVATAAATYFPAPEVDTIQVQVTRTAGDTTVSLTVRLGSVAIDDYYFVSYHSSVRERKGSATPGAMPATLASFSPRQLTLLSGEEMRNGCITRTIPLTCKGDDTLLVHTAKIDKAYYHYLTAYKRSGALISQLTGEPVNLPTNVIKGLGFFTLSVPARSVFYLKDY